MRERGREGRGRGVLPSSFLPRSSGGGRAWPSAAGGGHPPSSRGRPPWGTTMDKDCLLKPAFPLYRQDTQLQTPRRGPAASPRASALLPRGCPGRRPRLPPRLPAEPAAHSLCSGSGKSHTPYRPVASDHPPRRGREATAPPCLRHPSRSGAWSRERPQEGRGCSEGTRGQGWALGPWTPLGPPS